MRTRPMFYLAACLLAAGSVPSHAETVASLGTEQAKTSGATSAAGSAEKKICRKLVTSGSRFADRVCLTKEQWKKVEAEG